MEGGSLMDNFSNITELLNEQMRINLQLQIQQMRNVISNHDIPLPSEPSLQFYIPPISVSNCMIDYYDNYKTDCYWYTEETTMDGHIHICRKSGYECDCKECEFYLSISEVDKIIERIENVKEEE